MELVSPSSPILNQVSDHVKASDIHSPQIQSLIDRMLEQAAGKGGSKTDSRQMVGLAAVQLGESRRIIILDITADGSKKEQHLQVVINPRIDNYSDETMPGREGCWSCGNICGNVERAKSVTISGTDREGTSITLDLAGFVARIAQHEIDHLGGIRFPDRISVDEPHRLHWVEPGEFEMYRKEWMNWPNICPREKWELLKRV